jgi:excisionase family DNA binding protein
LAALFAWCCNGRFSGEEKNVHADTTTVVEAEQAHFRPEEAAKYLRIGRTSMFMLLKTKVIPSATVGRTRIIRRVDLDAYISRKLEAAG